MFLSVGHWMLMHYRTVSIGDEENDPLLITLLSRRVRGGVAGSGKTSRPGAGLQKCAPHRGPPYGRRGQVNGCPAKRDRRIHPDSGPTAGHRLRRWPAAGPESGKYPSSVRWDRGRTLLLFARAGSATPRAWFFTADHMTANSQSGNGALFPVSTDLAHARIPGYEHVPGVTTIGD